MVINSITEYNLMMVCIHLTESVKYMKFMLKDKTFNMPESIRNRFRMIINNIAPFEAMIFTILNKKVHEELSLTIDDFMRLMINNPEKRDDLMIALNLYVENY